MKIFSEFIDRLVGMYIRLINHAGGLSFNTSYCIYKTTVGDSVQEYLIMRGTDDPISIVFRVNT